MDPFKTFKDNLKNQKSTDTVVFGDVRFDIITKIKDMITKKATQLNTAKFVDNEWNISKYPKAGIFNNGVSATTADFITDVSGITVKPLSVFMPGIAFFEHGSARPGDVAQGADGDCWFVAVLAAIADIHGLVESVAVARDEKVGIYGFVFHKDNKWVGTIIDDSVYVSGTNLTFCRCQTHQTWVPLLEKAYAKIHGDYEGLNWGNPNASLIDLCGQSLNLKDYTTQNMTQDDKNKLWNLLFSAKQLKTVVTCWYTTIAGHPANGLIPSHIYSVLRAVDFHGNKLVEVRNPWAHTEWTGAWADRNKNNPALGQEWLKYIGPNDTEVKELNYSFLDDGSFFMSFDDFVYEFWQIESCVFPFAQY